MMLVKGAFHSIARVRAVYVEAVGRCWDVSAVDVLAQFCGFDGLAVGLEAGWASVVAEWEFQCLEMKERTSISRWIFYWWRVKWKETDNCLHNWLKHIDGKRYTIFQLRVPPKKAETRNKPLVDYVNFMNQGFWLLFALNMETCFFLQLLSSTNANSFFFADFRQAFYFRAAPKWAQIDKWHT